MNSITDITCVPRCHFISVGVCSRVLWIYFQTPKTNTASNWRTWLHWRDTISFNNIFMHNQYELLCSYKAVSTVGYMLFIQNLWGNYTGNYSLGVKLNMQLTKTKQGIVWWRSLRPDWCLAFVAPPCGAFDLGLVVSVPLPIVMGIFVLLWFQSRLT